MQQIEEDINTGSFHSVYLIFGEEAYLKLFWKKKLREALVSADDTMNCTVYSGKDLDVGALIDQAETMPFFADHRLILVEDSGLFARGAGGEEEGSAGSSAGASSAGTGSAPASAGAASVQLVVVQLRAKDPGAETRKHNKTVGNIYRLCRAVISPQLFRPVLQERIQVVKPADGFLYCA